MKNTRSLSLTLCAISFVISSFAQETNIPDSLAKSVTRDSIFITPNQRMIDPHNAPAFIANGKDPVAFQTYAGLNVLNSLRGLVPNLTMNADQFNPAAVSIRSGQALLVIDGLPQSGLISDHYNLNAMEYSGLYAVSGGNAVASYGYTAPNGAIFLTSKNGAGHDRPVFEFNSTTVHKQNVDRLSVPQPDEQLIFSNSLAYMQDYGDADLRISYNILSHPGENGSNDLLNHSLKFNTGFVFDPRITGRLIVDHINGNRTIAAAANGQPTPQEITIKHKRQHTQAQLSLSFEVLPWLHINTQGSISKVSKDEIFSDQPNEKYDINQRRALANVFATIDLPLTDDLSFHSFAGVQRIDQRFVYLDRYSEHVREYDSRVISGGGGLAYKNYLFGNFTYRDERAGIFRTYPGVEHQMPAYGLSSVFIFTKAFNMPFLSSGKFRISQGKTNPWFDNGYPFYEPHILGVYHVDAPQQKQLIDAGIDLGFLSDKLTLSATWFKEKNESTIAQYPIYGMLGYYRIGWEYPASHRSTGWEFVANVKSLQQYAAKMKTTFTWSNYRRYNETQNANVSNPSISIPDWQSTILHQITWKNLFASAMLDFVYGGHRSFYVSEGAMQAHITRLDVRGMFRDISLGYIAARPRNAEKKYRECQVSVSLRNIEWYKQHSSPDGISDELSAAPKNISVSLSLIL